MNELLHPAQIQAVDKLKRLRVGALYIERQEGKLRTVMELLRYRFKTGRIDGVIWICAKRKRDRIAEGVRRYLPDAVACVQIVGVEALSHSLTRFIELMELAGARPTMIVIDNGLLIKNSVTLRTQRVQAISERCAYRLLVSDVPFTKQVSDLFAQWYALDWRILGYRTYWGFCVNHLPAFNRPAHTDYLMRAIEPYCAQILREDVQPTAQRRELVWQFPLPPQRMAEYREVFERFAYKAQYSTTGVYRMLQACQHVVCGRQIVEDYPLRTRPCYEDGRDDPRLCALMETLTHFAAQRVLILCRYSHECETVGRALQRRYGAQEAGRYTHSDKPPRLTVMNVFADERETARLGADVIIYYSSDWNWRKRQEKERQCQGALCGGTLTVVSLVAADTIDMQILRCIWTKDNLIRRLREELNQSLTRK